MALLRRARLRPARPVRPRGSAQPRQPPWPNGLGLTASDLGLRPRCRNTMILLVLRTFFPAWPNPHFCCALSRALSPLKSLLPSLQMTGISSLHVRASVFILRRQAIHPPAFFYLPTARQFTKSRERSTTHSSIVAIVVSNSVRTDSDSDNT